MKHIYRNIEKICVYFASLIFGGILLYLLLMSMNSTSICYSGEHTYYLKDSPTGHILVIAALMGIILLIKNKFHAKAPHSFLKICVSASSAAIVLLVLLTQLEPISDQEKVMLASKQFLMGNYSAWEPGGYAFYFRHQNGIILITAGILRLIGTYNYVGLQLINAVLLTLSLYLVYRISLRVFGRSYSENAVSAALFFYVPLWFFATFIYGTVIGFAAMMASVFFTLRYLDDGKWQDALGAALFMALAATAKSNYYIMLIAVGIMLVVKLAGANWKRALTLILLTAVCVTGAAKGVDAVIESHTGKELSAGQPAEVWVAMGLSEGWLAPGWINGMSDYIYRDSGFDREKTRWASRNYISQFAERAKTEEKYAERFFTKKTASEWNNPVFECFQLLEDRGTKISVPVWLQRFINTGTLSNRMVGGIFNYVQTIILFGALMYLILTVRNMRIEELLFGIVFIGGFLFHMFWEACCTYTIPYFVLLIPYSVNGYGAVCDRISAVKAKNADRRKSLFTAAVLAVVFTALVLRSVVYFAGVLPDDTEKYRQYLAALNRVSLKNGTYTITPANSGNTIVALYDEDAADGAPVGVVMKDAGRNQQMCLARVREINDYERYNTLTSTYYIWMDQNKFYLYADEKNDSIFSKELGEEDGFLWRLEYIGEDLYIMYGADGSVLEYSPVNGVLFLNEKDSSNEYQIWRISAID